MFSDGVMSKSGLGMTILFGMMDWELSPIKALTYGCLLNKIS